MATKIIQTTPNIGIGITLQRLSSPVDITPARVLDQQGTTLAELAPGDTYICPTCTGGFKLMWLIDFEFSSTYGKPNYRYCPEDSYGVSCIQTKSDLGDGFVMQNKTRAVIWGTQETDDVQWQIVGGSDTSVTAAPFTDLNAQSAYLNWTHNTGAGTYWLMATVNGVALENSIQILIINRVNP